MVLPATHQHSCQICIHAPIWMNRMRMVATWALVAGPWGLRVVVLVPEMRPVLRLLQIMCKPPEWCRIEASHRRLYIYDPIFQLGRSG